MWNWKDLPVFFWTTKNIKATYGSELGFELFGLTHLTWLAIAVFVCAALIFVYVRLGSRARRRMLLILAAAMVLDECLKYALTLSTGQFEVQFLPFHLCSVNIFISVWYAIRPNRAAANILYCISLPAAIIALLMPSWKAAPMWNLMQIHSETIHMLLVVFPLLLFVDGFRPEFKQTPKILAFVATAAVPAVIFNAIFDTNFMFLNGTAGNPVLELCADIFGEKLYTIGVLILLALVIVLMYLPWIITAGVKNRKARISKK